MKKIICITFCVLLCAAALSGEAPELQVVMPNSWKKLERVADNADAEQIVKTMQPDITKALGYDAADSFFTSCTYSTVYRQATKDAMFYRLVFSNCPVSEIANLNHWFYQALVRQTKKGYRLYGMAVYNYLSDSVKGDFDGVSFGAVDIVESDGNTKGILFSLVGSSVTPPQNCLQTGLSIKVPYKFAYTTKKQLSGGTDARYYLLRDLERSDFSIESRQFFEWYEPKGDMGITITASDCLIDARCPLKYGIQNAFDGDPATSYVENTDDDLMEITCYTGKPSKKIAIINGYAKDTTLYYKNNRIKETDDYFEFNDNELGYQFMLNKGSAFKVTQMYKGAAYNDTCLAECNILFNDGWLFGDVNE